MNTTINAFARIDEQLLAAVAAAKNRDFATDDDPPYITPAGAEHRTFEVRPRSSFERWLLTTFTVAVAERLWVNSYCPFVPLRMKLTFREGTLERPELNWLLERVLDLSPRTSDDLQLCVTEQPAQQRPLRWEVLSALATHVHSHLGLFDVIAMVKHLTPVMDRAHFDVAALNIPSPRDDLPAFERHMRICKDCLRLAYVDDTYLR